MSPKPAPPKQTEVSPPRSPLKSCDLEDDVQPDKDISTFVAPMEPVSTDEEGVSKSKVTEQPAESMQEEDQQTEEELMLALELDTDESFSKDSHSDTGGKSPRNIRRLEQDTSKGTGSPSRVSQKAAVQNGETAKDSQDANSQLNGVNSVDMSEEFSVITNKKDRAKMNGETPLVPFSNEMSEEFSVIQNKKRATEILLNSEAIEEMETEEMSTVLEIANNNMAKNSKMDRTEEDKFSQTETKQDEWSEDMESESIPLIWLGISWRTLCVCSDYWSEWL